MLVLSRKTGETIMIGDQIQIQVLSFRRGRVRLGIVAPGTVRIHRSEVAHSAPLESNTVDKLPLRTEY